MLTNKSLRHVAERFAPAAWKMNSDGVVRQVSVIRAVTYACARCAPGFSNTNSIICMRQVSGSTDSTCCQTCMRQVSVIRMVQYHMHAPSIRLNIT
jgi:hypothetical protein